MQNRTNKTHEIIKMAKLKLKENKSESNDIYTKHF